MGNDQSQLPGVEIEEKAVEVSDFWTQHLASLLNSDSITNLSVFVGELFVNGSLWSHQTPLEKSGKNLMIYRHPCIIKYISSWQKNSKFYLAVEEVTPLSQILPKLDAFQICVGLYSILKALHFLHETASASHNNVCIASIYVTKNGSWKLGGMEYLCRYRDLNFDYLNKSRTNRYDNAIDANEGKLLQNSNRKDFIDVYAFGVLVCEILKSRTNDDIPNLVSFYEYCSKELQNSNLSQRPKITSILEHDFFSHDFLSIYSFLVELPLKSDEEKTLFFQYLKDRLKNFDEVVVANQLGSLLLSRMVLLYPTAQECLLPFLLIPRIDPDSQPESLFSEETFKKFISPKLLEIIRVRDAQIRLLLLTHFPNFMHTFSKDELQSYILPELLVGIKDTNDHLVAVTLRTLADLVPILGAATVIGGKRAKLFNDGRPITHPSQIQMKVSTPQEIEQPVPSLEVLSDHMSLSGLVAPRNLILPERSRPDGEEVETSTEEVEQSVDEDLENWEDWDVNEINPNTNNLLNNEIDIHTVGVEHVPDDSNETIGDGGTKVETDIVQKIPDISKIKRVIPDIDELDIKNQLNTNEKDDFDFFQDMEPVINTSNKFLINESQSDVILYLDKDVSSKLALNDNDVHEEGWGDGDWE